MYIDNLKKFKKLTNEESRELFARYKSGDLGARNQLIESVLQLTVHTINRCWIVERYREDVLSDAFLRVTQAIDSWDGRRPLAKFMATVVWNVASTKWSSKNLVYMNPSTAKIAKKTDGMYTAEEISGRLGVSLKRARELLGARAALAPVHYQSNNTVPEMEHLTVRPTIEPNEPCMADLEEMVSKLPEIEKKVFSMRMGLSGKEMTATETGKILGISTAKSSEYLRLAKNRLRQMAFIEFGGARVMDDLRACKFCSAPFRPNQPIQKFCGLRCQGKWRLEQIKAATKARRAESGARSCKLCGDPYTPTGSAQKFCTTKCKEKYRLGQDAAKRMARRVERGAKGCKLCGVPYIPTGARQEFCTKKCREKYRLEQDMAKRKTCLVQG
jgi:RNA polymerase sigma factor (sigma-70 family)